MADAQPKADAGRGAAGAPPARVAPVLFALSLGVYTAAWLLPVADGGSTFGSGVVPGWEAVRVALSPLLPYQDFIATQSFRASLPVASALTNVLYILAAVAAVRLRRSRRRLRWLAAPVLIATAINAQWIWSSPVRLSWGYFCWLTSFAMLAAALLLWRGQRGSPADDRDGAPVS